MKKLLKQPWFVAVLAISAVVLCTFSLREQMGMNGPKAPPGAASAVPEPALSDDVSGDESATLAPEGTRSSIPAILAALVLPPNPPDPFTRRGANLVAGDPAVEPPARLPDERDSIHLTAVWQQGSVLLALVNNRIVRVGDQLGRVTIAAISVDGIWVSHWKGRDFVAFGADFILLTPAGGTPASLALHEN